MRHTITNVAADIACSRTCHVVPDHNDEMMLSTGDSHVHPIWIIDEFRASTSTCGQKDDVLLTTLHITSHTYQRRMQQVRYAVHVQLMTEHSASVITC